MRMAEEIWAPSNFAVDIVRMSADPSPAVLVPWPAAPAGRLDAGPDGSIGGRPCVFLSMVDCLGGLTWDNPFATIAAYHDAFPPSKRAARPNSSLLRVTSPRARRAPERCREGVAAVPGHLGGGARRWHGPPPPGGLRRCRLPPPGGGARFGLRLADAAASGEVVPSDRYGGSLHFLTHQNACLVGYRYHRLRPAERLPGPWPETGYVPGRFVSQPDIDDADAMDAPLIGQRRAARQLSGRAQRNGLRLDRELVGVAIRAELGRVTAAVRATAARAPSRMSRSRGDADGSAHPNRPLTAGRSTEMAHQRRHVAGGTRERSGR